jgi:GR25 family glycosyltransferase involved in LPS biosynthesis
MNNIKKYIVGIDIIYWINLDRVEDRRQSMKNILSNFPIENKRISAIDGKNETDENIYGKFNQYNSKYKKTEYACLLSHLNTIKTFSESKHKIALILEDDISLDFVKYWNKSIKNIMSNAPCDWDIIMLNYNDENNVITDTYTLRKPGDKIWSGLSYLINIDSAKKLINKILINNKYLLDDKSLHVTDDFVFNNMNTYIYKYAYFTYPDDNTSSITPNSNIFMNRMKNNHINIWKEYYIDKKNNCIKSCVITIIIVFILFLIYLQVNDRFI